MKKEYKMTCILCPVGCGITAQTDGSNIISIEGNACKRGEKYATEEVEDPRRNLTTTVRVEGGEAPVASVKSSAPLPKDKLFDSMDIIAKTIAEAPLEVGDVVVKDIFGIGVDIVATCSIDAI